jgi:transposase
MAGQDGLFEDVEGSVRPSGRKHVRNSLVFRKPRHSEDQPQVLAPTIGEMIPEDSPVRMYRAMTNSLGFSSLLDTYVPFGGISYDPRILAALWLFAATDGVHTSRELEKHCQYDVRYMFLAGGQVPDHTTLSRFRNRLTSISEDFFAETVELAKGLGLGVGGTATLDGRKTAGALDQWRTLRKNTTEEELWEISDPEARTLRCTRTGFVNGYSCMACVDTQDDIVLGACISRESNDAQALRPLMEAVRSQNSELPATMVMDAGFEGSECAGQLGRADVLAFIGQKEPLFWDLDADGEVVCPAGHRLTKIVQDKPRPNQRYSIRQCAHCLVKELCGTKSSKTITVKSGEDPKDLVRANILANTPEGRMRLAYRKGSIERLFAQLFYHQKFRAFTLRGMIGAKIQFHLLCAAHNLRVIAKRLQEMFGIEGLRALANIYRALLQKLFDLTNHKIRAKRTRPAKPQSRYSPFPLKLTLNT